MNQKPNIPQHVAIIMDGNGRWAQQQGKERMFGHAKGGAMVRQNVIAAIDSGVRYLTLFAFSTENWGRPQEEVEYLMELLCSIIASETPELKEQGVKVDVIGDMTGLSSKVVEQISKVKEQTKDGCVMTLILAINYSARWEVVQMVRRISEAAVRGAIEPAGIDYATVQANLTTVGYPDPDLLIRTSGECRLSNFLLLQVAYAELYFTDTLWPDFGREEFSAALAEYQKRNRRYGILQK